MEKLDSQLLPVNAQHYCPPEQRKYVLIAGILASAMGFIDGSVVSVALPQIRSSLDADFVAAQWISNSYLLMLSALILFGGALGDQLGLRRTFGAGIALFVVASIACALAPSKEILILARVLQGMGAAVMVPGSMAIISLNTPREERGRALGLWVAASSITAAMGPMLGGLALTYGGPETWRWIFAINLPIGILVLLLLWCRVPDDMPQAQGGLRALDWIGAALVTVALGAMAFGLTMLSDKTADTLHAMGLITLGLLALWATVLWELRLKRSGIRPMIDPNLFASRPFSGANLLTFLVWSGLGALFFFLPMMLIVGWKLPASYAGGLFLPFSLTIALLSPFAGRWSDRLGVRLFLTLGPIIVGLAHLMTAFAILNQAFWNGLLPAMVVFGIGFGLAAAPLSTAIMNSVSDTEGGAASGINNMVARMSNMFAIAGLGAVVAYAYGSVLRASDLHEDLVALMEKAGFGERLTGPLYQVGTERLQMIAMDHAMITLCFVLALLCFAGAATGWLTLPTREKRERS